MNWLEVEPPLLRAPHDDVDRVVFERVRAVDARLDAEHRRHELAHRIRMRHDDDGLARMRRRDRRHRADAALAAAGDDPLAVALIRGELVRRLALDLPPRLALPAAERALAQPVARPRREPRAAEALDDEARGPRRARDRRRVDRGHFRAVARGA